jgi:hypothetical protein
MGEDLYHTYEEKATLNRAANHLPCISLKL